jgi:hypothetical protein
LIRSSRPLPEMGIMLRSTLRALLMLLILLAGAEAPTFADSRTIARSGKGFLEDVDGTRVLHLKGTPREMGLQHGSLLKADIVEEIRFLFDVKAREFKPEVLGLKVALDPRKMILMISQMERKHTPGRYYEELAGIAEGSGVPVEDVIAANFIPEMFHCSGFALSGSATKDGTLYHGRILDYGCDWKLQDHAVLVVAEPDGAIPFVNVTYAGFIGSVTGMNAKKISVGEMTTSTKRSPSSATILGPASTFTSSPTARLARASGWKRAGTTSPSSRWASPSLDSLTRSRTAFSSRPELVMRNWRNEFRLDTEPSTPRALAI